MLLPLWNFTCDGSRVFRFKKEQRARCRVFEEWLAEYKKDQSPHHKAFFKGYLRQNYEDFAAYRKIADSGGEKEARRSPFGQGACLSGWVRRDGLGVACVS